MPDSDIHITRWGTSGPVVVMVHGSAQGSQVGGDGHFSRQQDLAGMGWQVVVPDRSGHGRSPAPGRPDDAEADGEWVAEQLGEGTHLVGHSFGGCVALAAAAKQPGAVRSLTLIEPAMMPLTMDNLDVRAFAGKIMESANAPTPADRIKAFTKVAGIPDEIRGGKSEDELNRMGVKALKLPTSPTLREQRGAARNAGIPLLVVEGGWNPAFGAVADRVAEAGGGKHVVVKSENHFPQLASDDFNQQLDAFMRNADA